MRLRDLPALMIGAFLAGLFKRLGINVTSIEVIPNCSESATEEEN